MVLLDRSRSRRVGRLEWRVRIMGAGAILAVLGMYFEARWLIWIAIAVLVCGFLVRFLPDDEEAWPTEEWSGQDAREGGAPEGDGGEEGARD